MIVERKRLIVFILARDIFISIVLAMWRSIVM